MQPRRQQVPLEAHRFIRRGRAVLHLSTDELAVMFDVTPGRIRQILAGLERAKVGGEWVTRKRGQG